MIITNKLGLPAPLVSLAQEEYESAENEYRVTSLLRGVRETILEKRHRHEVERDVADMIWLLFGKAVHSVLENHAEQDDELKEMRIKVPVCGGLYILSGQFDLYTEGERLVTDYKTASVWKVVHEDFSDWRQQVLAYCWMLRRLGFEADSGRVVAFLKDHSKADARKGGGYPQLPVHVVTFSFSEDDFRECGEWLEAQFAEIAQAEQLPDDQLPLCSPEERFNSGDRYAVMKRGRKTALRLFDSKEDAELWMTANGGDYIEVRAGEDKKCRDYCSVNVFCNHYCEQKEQNGE